MSKSSIIITHYKRKINLVNTLIGLSLQSMMPHEVIIVNLGPSIEIDENFPFSVLIVPYPLGWTELPIASARNFGASCSSSENLIFLDVDCIPNREFCREMEIDSLATGGLVMGSPRYMLNPVVNIHDGTALRMESIRHPHRPIVESLHREHCYELFWSLCFSIQREIFDEMEGFDEMYEGYGGEDTDFALAAKSCGIHFYINNSEVYHQQHPVYAPPLNHFGAIIANSNYYRTKWGAFPMQDVLSDFANMGFIRWKEHQTELIEIIKCPDTTEISAQLIPNAPYR